MTCYDHTATALVWPEWELLIKTKAKAHTASSDCNLKTTLTGKDDMKDKTNIFSLL